jgi:hypothetical protein
MTADYYSLPGSEEGGEWLHVSFPSAKDPTFHDRFPEHSTCVVETEMDDVSRTTASAVLSLSHRSLFCLTLEAVMDIRGEGMFEVVEAVYDW